MSRLRHRITIRKRTRSSDGQGGAVSIASDVVTVWANVKPFQSQEGLFGGQREEQESSIVRIRYRSDVSTDMEVLFRGRTLNVVGIRNVDERDRWTDMTCVEDI